VIESFRIAQPAHGAPDANLDGRERLAQFIVKLPGERRSFPFDHGLQPARKQPISLRLRCREARLSDLFTKLH
jgi:hypothetical protein